MRFLPALAALAIATAACSDGLEPAAEPEPTTTTALVAAADDPTTSTTTAAPPPTTTAARGAAAPTGVGAVELCATAEHVAGPAIVDERLTEISGIAFSRADPTVLYAHNDSGGAARIYSLEPSGETAEALAVDAIAVDWEDMATIEGTVFVADTGDNFGIRPTVRVVEIDEVTRVTTSYTFAYPSGRPDAEALIVEPTGAIATIITKDLTGNRSRIYEVALDSEAEVIEAVDRGELAIDGLVTGADLSADGYVIAVRTTDAVWLFDRFADQSVAEALQLAPCPAPSVGEIQGEAIALHVDGRGYTTISEGLNPVRNDFRLP